MLEHIASRSYENVAEDTKLVRLTTVTTMIHSLIFVLYILYQIYWISHNLWNKRASWSLRTIIRQFWDQLNIWLRMFVVGIILIIWYYLLPPVGQWAIVTYLDHPNKKWSDSLMWWIRHFFPMFKLEWAMRMFQLTFFLVIISRAWMWWIINEPVILIALIVRFFVIICVQFATPYTKFLVVIEKKTLNDAIMTSINMSLDNFSTTFRWVILWFVLTLRFLINWIILAWIPLWMLWVANRFNILSTNITQTLIVIVSISLILLTAYINWMVEAFFVSYWYNIFKELRKIE